MPSNVIALFDDMDNAEDAVHALCRAGFAKDRISLVAHGSQGLPEPVRVSTTDPRQAGLAGAGIGAAAGLLAGIGLGVVAVVVPGAGAVFGVGPLLALIGAPVVGAAAGGLIGALTSRGLPEARAHGFAEGLRRGGVLLVVDAPDGREVEAEQILRLHGAVDLESRTAWWRSQGWTGYDPDAPPLTEAEIEEERARLAARGQRFQDQGRDAQRSQIEAGRREQEGGREEHYGLTAGWASVDQQRTELHERELAREFRERHPDWSDAVALGREFAERYPDREYEDVEAQAHEEWRRRVGQRTGASTWQNIWGAFRHGFDPEYPPPWRRR